MKTFQVEVTVPANRQLMIELPEDVAVGNYQVVVVMNPTPVEPQVVHRLNALAGQVQSFRSLNAVDWQQQVRAAWDDA
ncbi:hypothetical protein U2F10_08225 [Leptothoe sp. EHU-05/26/07-4]